MTGEAREAASAYIEAHWQVLEATPADVEARESSPRISEAQEAASTHSEAQESSHQRSATQMRPHQHRGARVLVMISSAQEAASAPKRNNFRQ